MRGSSIDPSTSDEWVEVADFPTYYINEDGLVQNGMTGRNLVWSLNNGVPYVQLKSEIGYRGYQVCTLMVRSWLLPPEHSRFNTPTHLDGNRLNCNIHNLILRPRWFAIAYHKEIRNEPFPTWNGSFIMNEEEVFTHPRDCAMKYGFLQKDIVLALHNGGFVFPGAHIVRFV